MTLRVPFLVLCILFALSAGAQVPRNELSLTAGWTDFADLGAARAAGASYSRFWTPNIATRFGALFTGDKVGSSRGATNITDLHAMVQLHAFRHRMLSPWIGLGLAYIDVDDPDARTASSKTGATAGTGLDVRVSRHLAIGGEFHYAQFAINPRDRFGLTLDPATISAAVRWRY